MHLVISWRYWKMYFRCCVFFSVVFSQIFGWQKSMMEMRCSHLRRQRWQRMILRPCVKNAQLVEYSPETKNDNGNSPFLKETSSNCCCFHCHVSFPGCTIRCSTFMYFPEEILQLVLWKSLENSISLWPS